MKEYKVIRTHWADKEYKVGSIRFANPADVAAQVGRCLVEVKAEKPKKKEADVSDV